MYLGGTRKGDLSIHIPSRTEEYSVVHSVRSTEGGVLVTTLYSGVQPKFRLKIGNLQEYHRFLI